MTTQSVSHKMHTNTTAPTHWKFKAKLIGGKFYCCTENKEWDGQRKCNPQHKDFYEQR